MLTNITKIDNLKVGVVESHYPSSQDSEVDHHADLVIATRGKAQLPPTPTKRSPLSRQAKMKREMAKKEMKMAKGKKRGRKVKATARLSPKLKVTEDEEEDSESFSAIVLLLKPVSYANVKAFEDEEVESKMAAIV